MKNLKEVTDFGGIDADHDALLMSCFEDHDAYLKIKDYTRSLIVGKKGSGKTAIFKHMLMKSNPNYFCFGHTFSDYPWHYHDMQARVGIPDADKFTHSWKYLILLTVAKILLNNDNSVPFDDASMELMVKIEKFVIDTYGTRDPDVTQIFTPSKTLKIKPNFEIDLGLFKGGVAPENVPMDYLPKIAQELNITLMNYIVRCLNPANEYFVCFDQLDLGFDPKSPDYNNRLIGLLLAVRDINIVAKAAGKKLFVVVFLRDDIYSTLHFEDKNKLTENILSSIEWDTARTTKTLKSLMERRFKAVLGHDAKWDDIFDETKEMSGHQKKYQHILDRTYLRPRDVIKFVNAILKQYQIRSQADPAVSKIENVDINNARGEYSDYLERELDDEIHKHLPHYTDLLDLVRKIGFWQFSLESFSEQYDASTLVEKIGTPLQALQELYDFSLIGFYRPGGGGYGGSEYIFKYKDARVRFDSTATRFRVHPGLIDALGLKKSTFKEEVPSP